MDLEWLWIGVVLILLIFLASAIKIVKEYERGVIFRLGRLVGARGPGLFFIIPIIESIFVVDLRTITYDVPLYTFIFEPNGLFYSSHIEYDGNLEGKAEIILPPNSTVNSEDVSIIAGSTIKKPSNLLITRFPKNRVLISCSTESNSLVFISGFVII
ncbi:MAG: SPFH domain-containing protein [Archaeoglobaceae archaeon]